MTGSRKGGSSYRFCEGNKYCRQVSCMVNSANELRNCLFSRTNIYTVYLTIGTQMITPFKLNFISTLANNNFK